MRFTALVEIKELTMLRVAKTAMVAMMAMVVMVAAADEVCTNAQFRPNGSHPRS